MQRKRPRVKAGRVVFGGEKYLLCVPLVSKNTEQLVADADAALEFEPDLFEWRVDHFEAYPEPAAIVAGLSALRAAAGDKPILFTTRHFQEDGAADISDEDKFELIEHVSRAKLVELIDIEQRYGQELLLHWQSKLHKRGIKLIVSHHAFNKKMTRSDILNTLRCGQEWGADICKIIVKANSYGDLADFSDAIHEARDSFLKVPVIAGAVGKASPFMRVLGDYLGSDMTFAAAGGSRSHAAQLHIQDIKRLRSRL